MHDHALSNWDRSQSKKKSLSAEAEKVKDRELNILSDQHEELVSPNFASISKGRLSMDTTTTELSGNLFVKNSLGSVNSRRTSTVCLIAFWWLSLNLIIGKVNEHSKSDHVSIQRDEQVSVRAFGLGEPILNVVQTLGLKPIAPLPSRTLSAGYAQIQVGIDFFTCSIFCVVWAVHE